MPANTPIYGFPYPLGTDPVRDGDNDIRALAEDVETVLDTQVGLWLVKTQTIGSAVASVDVTNAFSADYDAYKVIVTGGSSSATTRLRIAIGAANTAYYWSLVASRYDNGGAVAVGGSNAALFDYVGQADSTVIDLTCEIRNPFLTEKTFISASFADISVGAFTGAGVTTGILANTTSYTQFTISPASGTLTGGTIRVYGYRN